MSKKVDLKLYSQYEEILRKYNNMRKRITRRISKLKDDSKGGRLPSMVVPQRQRKIQQRTAMKMSRRMLRMKIKALYGMVRKGEESFFKDFKRSYLELYRAYIIEENPELKNGMYSKEQIELMAITDSQMAQFMHDYNAIVRMNPKRFITRLYTGKIPEFKWLYREIVLGISGYQSFAEQMHEAIKLKSVRSESEDESNEAISSKVSSKKETKKRMEKTRRDIANYENRK